MPGRAWPPTSFEERLPPAANALWPFLLGGLLLPTADRQGGQSLGAKFSFPAYFRFRSSRRDGEANWHQPVSQSFLHRQNRAALLAKQVSCLRAGKQEQFAKRREEWRKFNHSGPFKNRPASTFPSLTRPSQGELCAMWKKRRTRRVAFVVFGCAHPKTAFGKLGEGLLGGF